MNVTRNLIIGSIAAVLVTALLIMVFMGESRRLDEETKAQVGQSISRGAMLYDSYCGGCHGDRGQGIPGVYPPVNVEDMWAGREELAFYGTLEDYITLNISAGHPAQRMPSWSQEYGGPLRDDQIVDLARFVMNWQGPQPPGVREEGVVVLPTAPPEGATPEAPEGPVGEGDAANGETIFAANCASCHGANGEGGALGPSLTNTDIAAKDDAFFRETITDGRVGTAMPAWGPILGAQKIEDTIAWLRTKQ